MPTEPVSLSLAQAGVHPEQPGATLSREAFDAVWEHSVRLMQRGFQSGSILTVDPEEALVLGEPWTRRCGALCPTHRAEGFGHSWCRPSGLPIPCPQYRSIPLQVYCTVRAGGAGGEGNLFGIMKVVMRRRRWVREISVMVQFDYGHSAIVSCLNISSATVQQR